MSISKRWIAIEGNPEKVRTRYRQKDFPTIQQIADELGTTFHTVHHILKTTMTKAEYKALSAIRYSRSKVAEKNPMYGKIGDQHHNWIGLVDDGHGYLTCVKDGKRQFVHRIVMAEALGLKELPETLDVHHIDEDRKHNDLDNLALVTAKGHQTIHWLMVKDGASLKLKRSRLRDALKYMT